MFNFLILNVKDNVAVALKPTKAGELATPSTSTTIKVNQDIPFAHKIALKNIKTGEKINKYGEVIGLAFKDIAAGDHVHVHNIRSIRNEVKR